MKKLATMALAAVFLAACDDAHDPTGISVPQLDHTTPEHASSQFDLANPVLDGEETGGDVVLSWTTTDDLTQYPKWHFEVFRGEGELCETGDVDADEDLFTKLDDIAGDGYTDVGAAGNGYCYFVKAFAKEGTGQSTVTHHSHGSNLWLAGGVWTVDVTGGNVMSANLNKNANNFTFEFELLLDDVQVTDCREVYVTFDDATKLAGCDAATGAYDVHFGNPTKGTAGSWDAGFGFSGDGSSPFDSFTATSS